MSFEQLPPEILYLILDFLDSEKDRISLSGTCKRLRGCVPLKLKAIQLADIKFSKYNFPIRKVTVLNINDPSAVLTFIRRYKRTLQYITLDFFRYNRDFLYIDLSKIKRTLHKVVLYLPNIVEESKINVNTKELYIVSSIAKPHPLKVSITSKSYFEKVICDPCVDITNTVQMLVKELKIYIYSTEQNLFDFSQYNIESLIVNIVNTTSEVAFFVFEIPKSLKSLNISNIKNKCYIKIPRSYQLQNLSLTGITLLLGNFTNTLENLLLFRSRFFNLNKILIKNFLIFCTEAKAYKEIIAKTIHMRLLLFDEIKEIMNLRNSNLLERASQIVLHIQDASFNRELIITLVDFLKNQGFNFIKLKKCTTGSSEIALENHTQVYVQDPQIHPIPFREFFSGDLYILIANRFT